ncbi:CAP domain-containing protein [Asticcacaulis sp. BYS171W]|uniref:CAP domain-containing protein n=1 Tax=Asticcacaulis aquaticus TaxID=2984212 RepID=A0ABT5HUI2_9CAUL|nr:CAP domain-containing protein [Asticcacaulis aquaticus]MDC7683704.1 CAP domain-containing protein [Asticcacaulis aquaticus]
MAAVLWAAGAGIAPAQEMIVRTEAEALVDALQWQAQPALPDLIPEAVAPPKLPPKAPVKPPIKKPAGKTPGKTTIQPPKKVDASSTDALPPKPAPQPLGPVINAITYLIDDDARQRAVTVVALINVERAKAGCGEVRINEKLMQAAQRQSLSMSQQNYFYHYGNDGIKLKDRVKDTGYIYTLLGENIGAGQPTPAEIVTGWMNSPGHRANILNCGYEEVGIGYIYDPDDQPVGTETQPYRYYWTQVFGRHMKVAGI